MNKRSTLVKIVIIGILLLPLILPPLSHTITGHQAISVHENTESVDWWPQFKHDSQLTGFSTSPGPTTDNILWSYENNSCGIIGGGIAIVNYKVYIGSYGLYQESSGALLCLDAITGAEIWSYTFPPEDDNHWSIYGCPAIAEGKAFVCVTGDKSFKGYAYCFNADTGALIWRSQETGFCLNGPTVADGKVFFGTRMFMDPKLSELYCLDAETGTIIWEKEFLDYSCIEGAPAVFRNNVYFGVSHDLDAGTYCLNASTGKEIWQWRPSDQKTEDVLVSVSLANGKVFFGTKGGKSSVNNFPVSNLGSLYCLDAGDGHLLWRNHLRARGDYFSSSPAIAYGKVYVCNSKGLNGGAKAKILCLNEDQGFVEWEKRHLSISRMLSGYMTGGGMVSPSIADNMIYFGSASFFKSHLYCLDSTSGKQIWKFTLPAISNHFFEQGKPFPPASYFCSPSIADGQLYTAWGDIRGTKNMVLCFCDVNKSAPNVSVIGSRTSKMEEESAITIKVTNPQEDEVYYYISWGDGTIQDWCGPYHSGAPLNMNHKWITGGSHEIRIRAMDSAGNRGPISTITI